MKYPFENKVEFGEVTNKRTGNVTVTATLTFQRYIEISHFALIISGSDLKSQQKPKLIAGIHRDIFQDRSREFHTALIEFLRVYPYDMASYDEARKKLLDCASLLAPVDT